MTEILSNTKILTKWFGNDMTWYGIECIFHHWFKAILPCEHSASRWLSWCKCIWLVTKSKVTLYSTLSQRLFVTSLDSKSSSSSAGASASQHLSIVVTVKIVTQMNALYCLSTVFSSFSFQLAQFKITEIF